MIPDSNFIIALSPIFCPFWHPSDEKLFPPTSVRLWKAKVENYLVNSPPLSRSLSTNITVTNPTTFAKKSMDQDPRDYSPVLQGSCSTGNAHFRQGCQNEDYKPFYNVSGNLPLKLFKSTCFTLSVKNCGSMGLFIPAAGTAQLREKLEL